MLLSSNNLPDIAPSTPQPFPLVAGVVILAVVGMAIFAVMRIRDERSRPDGGVYAARPFRNGRRASQADKPMVAPADLTDTDAAAWIAGYHRGREQSPRKRMTVTR
jgi:hypothetical protein